MNHKLHRLVLLGLISTSLGLAYDHNPVVDSNGLWLSNKNIDRTSKHLEWLGSTTDDSESAKPAEKTFLDDLIGNDEDDDDDDAAKQKMTPQEIKQLHRRKYTRVHNAIFPLLIAYKLKFYTLVPLFIGALVLLVGTTGMAGFFFALFAAAAGLSQTHSLQ